MNVIDRQLQKIKTQERIGLMTHVVIGYPTLDDTVRIVKTMAKSGADLVELQIPFSDPLADGPTIMRACEKALQNGAEVKDAFTVMKILSEELTIPLLFMAYYNTVFKFGVERFCDMAKAMGTSGLIVPDMSIDEEKEEHFIKYCRKYSLANIQVISPASNENRLKKNAKVAKGFVYCSARQAVTGARDELDTSIISSLKRVKKFFKIPIAVGFGISQKKHLEQLARYADIAVVGSAIVDVITTSSKGDLRKNITRFLTDLS